MQFDRADHEDAMRRVADGVRAKENGDFIQAEALFQQALTLVPTHQAARYELAFIYYITDRRLDSVRLLQGLVADYPSDERAKEQMAIGAGLLGMRSCMVDVINSLRSAPSSLKFAARTMQFSSFVERFPLKSTLARLQRVETLRTYHNVQSLSDILLEAVQSRRPFSFIRLGDGEGTHLKIDLADEAEFCAIYEHSREVFRDIWFKGAIGKLDTFEALSDEFGSVVEEADILGVPFESWIRHEFRIGSITGISSLTNIVRFLERNQSSLEKSKGLCWQNIHFALAQSPLFLSLFKENVRFGLISGHRNLADAIRQKFQVTVDMDLKIPSEGAYKTVLGDLSDRRFHYPEVFEDIRRTLQSSDLSNHVILVAGGYLGKFYCKDVKRSGGVAIDIGSIADGWMGHTTRPGMENVRKL